MMLWSHAVPVRRLQTQERRRVDFTVPSGMPSSSVICWWDLASCDMRIKRACMAGSFAMRC